jgi:hypothetical protein
MGREPRLILSFPFPMYRSDRIWLNDRAGVNGAENASLTIMCGASSSASFERAKPVLGMMGKKVIMCGGLGMGLAAKLCNK